MFNTKRKKSVITGRWLKADERRYFWSFAWNVADVAMSLMLKGMYCSRVLVQSQRRHDHHRDNDKYHHVDSIDRI